MHYDFKSFVKLILPSFLCFALCVASLAQASKKASVPTKPQDPSKIELPEGEAMKLIEEIKSKILKEKVDRQYPPVVEADSSPLMAINIMVLAGKLDYVSKTLNLEEDTKISRKWFVEVQKILTGFVQVRQSMEVAVDNHSKDSFLKACESFERGQEVLKNLIEKPIKLTPEQLKRIREENDVIRAKLRAAGSQAKKGQP